MGGATTRGYRMRSPGARVTYAEATAADFKGIGQGTWNSVSYAFREDPEISLPYGERPIHFYDVPEDAPRDHNRNLLVTQAVWEAYQWNPPRSPSYEPNRFPSVPDPDASPKPGWDYILELIRENDLYRLHIAAEDNLSRTGDARKSLTDVDIDMDGQSLHIGEGLDHMSGLIHLVGDANEAGNATPLMVLRDRENRPRAFYRQSDVRRLLGSVADRENRVESAHNTIRMRYDEQARIRDDFSATYEARFEAARAAKDFVDNYEAHLAEAIDAYNPNTLPVDLPTIKEVLIERLEAAATGHQKNLKGALTQQAIDNWAACVDIDEALAEVSKRCALASIDIARVDQEFLWWRKQGTAWTKLPQPPNAEPQYEGDPPPNNNEGTDGEHYRQAIGRFEAKAAFDEGVRQIRAVTAANTPHWTVSHSGGHGIAFNEANPAGVKRYTDTEVTVTARHPDGKTIPGNCVIRELPKAVDESTGEPVRAIPTFKANADGSFDARIKVLGRPSGAKTLITVRGRNICGPSRIRIELVQPLVSP